MNLFEMVAVGELPPMAELGEPVIGRLVVYAWTDRWSRLCWKGFRLMNRRIWTTTTHKILLSAL